MSERVHDTFEALGLSDNTKARSAPRGAFPRGDQTQGYSSSATMSDEQDLQQAGINTAKKRIERFQRELLDRQHETSAEKAWGLRKRLAWEFAIDKEGRSWKEISAEVPAACHAI